MRALVLEVWMRSVFGFSESFMLWLLYWVLVYWVPFIVSINIMINVLCHWRMVVLSAFLVVASIGILYSWSMAAQIPMRRAAALYQCEMILSISIKKLEPTSLHFHWYRTKVIFKWSVQGLIFIWVISLGNNRLGIIYQPQLIWFISITAAFTIALGLHISHHKRRTVVEIQFTNEIPGFFDIRPFNVKWNMKRAQSKAQEVIIFVPILRKCQSYFGSLFLMAYLLWDSITLRKKNTDFISLYKLLHKKYSVNIVSP